MAFAEHGVIMLASVLNSERAIQVNIQIVRIFTKMRKMLASHEELLGKLEKIASKLAKHDNQFAGAICSLRHFNLNPLSCSFWLIHKYIER